MGSRGPAPTPTALRLLHGDRPGRINTREPQPTVGAPKAPFWIRKESRRHYRELVKLLEPTGVLTHADGYMLAMLAEAFTRYIEARDAVVSIKVAGRDGGMVRDQALTVEAHTRADVHRLSMQFGLTPASRASLVVGAAQGDRDLESLLS